MIITNKLGLPSAVVAAVSRERDRGGADYTVTELIAPPMIVRLERDHDNEMTEDASERIFALFGQAAHMVLERAGGTDLKEKRLTAGVAGTLVSGAFDNFALADGKLSDYKTCSPWSLIFPHPEWEQQVNLYALLLRQHGYDVRSVEVVALLRDWRKREARQNPNYPRVQVEVVPLTLWPVTQATEFLEARVRLHEAAKATMPAVCSPEERWEKPTRYAVLKAGAKRALRVLDSQAEAEDWMEKNTKGGVTLETRPGESTRCLDYCSVASFCPYGSTLKDVVPGGGAS